MKLRIWCWTVLVTAAAGWAAAQEPWPEQPAWPAPAPAHQNTIHRVVFPERPALELDGSEAAIRRLLARLESDDAAEASDAFHRLFWIGEPAHRALQPLVERARRNPRAATRNDSRRYKALYCIERFRFYRPVETSCRLHAPVVTATPHRLTSARWRHGVIGRPKSVTLEVNPLRCVSYGRNYRGMELILVNRSATTIEVARAGMRLDCIAEAETTDGWVAIETPPATNRRAPKVWKLKPGHGAESAVPLYTGTLQTRLRYRLSIRGQKNPVYSNIIPAKINPKQLTGKPGYLEHDHTPR